MPRTVSPDWSHWQKDGCYDKYLAKCLQKAADARGNSFWGRPPDHAGSYTGAELRRGHDGQHGDRVLAMANLAFEGTPISVKLSGIHWWYKTASHAAELTAGFYNRANGDGYSPIAAMLKKHATALNFTCVELRTMDQQEGFPEAMVKGTQISIHSSIAAIEDQKKTLRSY
ncbi:beta-amylase 2, chloroplastic-like protein [Tanacetum coccineum]